MTTFFSRRLLRTLPIFLLASRVNAAKPLSLEQAIETAQANDPELKMARALLQSSSANRGIVVASILPTLTVGRTYTEQRRRYHLGHTSEDPGLSTSKSGRNFIEIRQTIENPYRLIERFAIAREEIELAQIKLKQAENSLQFKVQSQYFNAIIAQRAALNADRNFIVAEKDLEMARRRFKGGYIHQSDFRRSEINLRRATATRVSTKETFSLELSILSTLIGLTEDQKPTELTTALPEEFAFEKSEGRWESRTRKSPNDVLSVRIAEQQQRIAKRELSMARSYFFPDLSLSARFRKTFSREDPYEDPAGPQYLLTAEWELFSGAKSYFEMQEKAAKLQVSSSQLEQSLQTAAVDEATLQSRLRILTSDLQSQRENLASLADILAASRQRFASGLVDSKQVSDDFSVYLDQETELIKTLAAVIETIAKLSLSYNQPELFRTLIYGS